MKFLIECANKIPNKKIKYLTDEYSIITEPHSRYSEFSIDINYVSLSVLNRKTTDIAGYFPDHNWIDLAPSVEPFETRGFGLVL